MKIALLNQSKADSAAFPRLAEGMKKFLDLFCADWGLLPIEVRWFPDAKSGPAGFVGCVVLDHADTDRIGYHDRDDDGNSIIKGFLDGVPNGELFRGPDGDGGSLLGLLQHEAAETAIDPFANCYVDRDVTDPATNKIYHSVAFEVADAVQELADTLTLDDGTLCDRVDYLLPGWFNPDASGGAFDRLGALTGAGTIAKGGYALVRETVAEDGQVCARTRRVDHPVQKMAEWRARLKALPTSRTSRRLAKRS